MNSETLLQSADISVFEHRCHAARNAVSSTEQFSAHTIAYVRQGSFGYQAFAGNFELLPGAMMVGKQCDEYRCTHDHHGGGDVCLSIHLAPEWVQRLGDTTRVWRIGALPPVPELVALAELACTAAADADALRLEQLVLQLCARFVEIAGDKTLKFAPADASQRRRAVETALWLDENFHQPVSLQGMADYTGLSSFHFLRVFTAVVGITPHQYLLRSRLRHAARLLSSENRDVTNAALSCGFNDLSNFVRTFHRATGYSPGRFARLSADRKILQV